MRETSKEVYKRLRTSEIDKLTGSPFDCFNEPIVREGRAALAKLVRQVRQLEEQAREYRMLKLINCSCLANDEHPREHHYSCTVAQLIEKD